MKKINGFGFYCTFIIYIVSSFLGIGFFSLIQISFSSSLISLATSLIVGLLFLLFFIILFNYEPNLSLDKKIINLFGKVIGKVINLLFICVVLFNCLSYLYTLTYFISSQFLSETPPILISITFCALIIYACTKSIKIILNSSIVFVLINISLFIIAILTLGPSIDINNFKPIFIEKTSNILLSSFKLLLLNFSPMYTILMIPKSSLKIPTNKKIISSYLISCLLISLVFLITLGNLGIHLASIYQFPEYAVLKRIRILNTITKVENIIALQWLFGLFYVTVVSVKNITLVLKIKNTYFNLSLLIGIIIYLSFKVFRDSTNYNVVSLKYTPYIRLVMVIIIILSVLVSRIKKKKIVKKEY